MRRRGTYCKLFSKCLKKRFAAPASWWRAPQGSTPLIRMNTSSRAPFVARLWSPPAQPACEARSEFQAPLSDALVGDDQTAFRQQQFDMAETQTEYVV